MSFIAEILPDAVADVVKEAFKPPTWAAGAGLGSVAGAFGFQRVGVGLPPACITPLGSLGSVPQYSSAACQSALSDQRSQWALTYGISTLLVVFVVSLVLAAWRHS